MRQYGLLFLMLGLPVVIYLLYVNTAENRYQSLPIYGPRKVLPTAVADGKTHPDDTLYFELPGVQEWSMGSINPVNILHLMRYDGPVHRLSLRSTQAARVRDVFRKNPLVHQFCLGVNDGAVKNLDSVVLFADMQPLDWSLDSTSKGPSCFYPGLATNVPSGTPGGFDLVGGSPGPGPGLLPRCSQRPNRSFDGGYTDADCGICQYA